MLDLQPPADQVATLLRGVRDDQLDCPTPCPDTSVANLLAHLLGLSIAFRDAARKVDGPTTSTPPDASKAELPADWRALIPRHLDELVAAWREPQAWEGDTQAGGVALPGAAAGHVANNELLLHGWDLAVATGQPFVAAEENLGCSWEMVSSTPDTPEAREGLFGPVVPVPDDAPLLDRTLGHAGRDPHWSPVGAT
jgi:uncharacterized protein (TIGR03086 family)